MATDQVSATKAGVDLTQSFERATGLSWDSVGAAMASGQAAIAGSYELTAKLLAFVQGRAKEGVAVSQQLVACRSVEALAAVHLEYVRGTLQAYSDAFDRWVSLNGKIMAGVVAPQKGSMSPLKPGRNSKGDAQCG